jgi:uncharacterized protein (TIGR00661 family)
LKKKINKIGIFISDEGFGHSVRQRVIINQLLLHNPKIKITIFNNKRLLFLKQYFGNKLNYKFYPHTLFTVKKKSGELNLAETNKILVQWPKKSTLSIRKLLKNKKELDFDLIISDLVPEAFNLAKILNIPSYGIARFAWDWFFYNTRLKNLKATQIIKNSLQMADKIYFSTFSKKKYFQTII